MINNLTGLRFGRLTVIELLEERAQRYVLYRCRCDCGAEVITSSKNLSRRKYPACDKCTKKSFNKAYDLTGQKFGALSVMHLSNERLYNCRTWVCRCECGKERLVNTRDLMSGKITHCSSKAHRNVYSIDLNGQHIGMLTILCRANGKDSKGSLLWRCRCACGTEKIYSADQLIHGGVVSCGCYRENVIAKLLPSTLHHIDGTCVEFLKRKMRSDNTSGCTGVTKLKDGKWNSYITFKGVRYDLGTFEKYEAAVDARKHGEHIHDDFLDWYYNEYSTVNG